MKLPAAMVQTTLFDFMGTHGRLVGSERARYPVTPRASARHRARVKAARGKSNRSAASEYDLIPIEHVRMVFQPGEYPPPHRGLAVGPRGRKSGQRGPPNGDVPHGRFLPASIQGGDDLFIAIIQRDLIQGLLHVHPILGRCIGVRFSWLSGGVRYCHGRGARPSRQR